MSLVTKWWCREVAPKYFPAVYTDDYTVEGWIQGLIRIRKEVRLPREVGSIYKTILGSAEMTLPSECMNTEVTLKMRIENFEFKDPLDAELGSEEFTSTFLLGSDGLDLIFWYRINKPKETVKANGDYSKRLGCLKISDFSGIQLVVMNLKNDGVNFIPARFKRPREQDIQYSYSITSAEDQDVPRIRKLVRRRRAYRYIPMDPVTVSMRTGRERDGNICMIEEENVIEFGRGWKISRCSIV